MNKQINSLKKFKKGAKIHLLFSILHIPNIFATRNSTRLNILIDIWFGGKKTRSFLCHLRLQ